jgi:hypothetical protein
MDELLSCLSVHEKQYVGSSIVMMSYDGSALAEFTHGASIDRGIRCYINKCNHRLCSRVRDSWM